jgi:hypothetical protein
MNDVETRLSALNPVPIEDVKGAAQTSEARTLLRRLLDEPPGTSAPSPSPRRPTLRARRRVRLPIVAGVGAIVLASTVIAWALAHSSARDTVSMQCMIKGRDTIIPSTTGDPVADCAAHWRRETGNDPPPLVAYDNGLGGITVMPVDEAPLPEATPLPDGATQNVSIIALQHSLDDYVDGLNSGCYDNATAVEMTEQTLARLGMADWTVVPAPATDSSPTSMASTVSGAPKHCVNASIIDPATGTVTLRSLGGPASPSAQYERLAAKLRSVAQRCMSLDAAARQVRSAASELGLSEAAREYELTEVRERGARCTTINENVGGTIFLILRGPASS